MNANQPSRTALVVAAGLQLAGPQAGFPVDALRSGAQMLRSAHPRIAGLLHYGWFRRACLLLERTTLPGICLHFALRKRILRQHARAALASGCEQVIVLGAGFDTLCMELKAVRSNLHCIEIDHPAMEVIRGRAASDSGIHFIAADLARQQLGQVLAAHSGFRHDADTLFVAEGLLMYMPLDAVRDLFAQMAVVAPRSRVAFTWFDRRADGRVGFRARSRVIDWWLRSRGEPFMSSMARTELANFLSSVGYELRDLKASSELQDGSHMAGQPIDGEYIALASAARG